MAAPLELGPYGCDYLLSRADENFTGSARGASKTFAAIAKIIQRVRYRQGYRALFFRTTIKQLSENSLPEFEKVASMLGHKNALKINKNTANLKVECPATGSQCYFSAAETSQDAERFQGANIPDVVVDEGQNVLPQVLEMIPAISRAAEGNYRPSMTWLANPNGPGHAWLRRRFIEPAKTLAPHGNIEHPRWIHPITKQIIPIENHWNFHVDIDVDGTLVRRLMNVWLTKAHMNPALDYPAYIAQLRESLKDNYTLASQWIENDWDALAGQFYPNVGRAASDSVSIHPYDRILCSIDQGQRKTAAVWAAVNQLGVYKIFNCRVYHHQDIPEKADAIRGERDRVELYIIDPSARQVLEGSGVRTVRRLYQEAGINPLVLCRSNDRRAGWEALRTGFNDATILIDKTRCRSLLDSLASLVTKSSDSEDCEKSDGTDWQDDGDHLSDALRYLVVNGFYLGQSEEQYSVDESMRQMMENPIIREALLSSNTRAYSR